MSWLRSNLSYIKSRLDTRPFFNSSKEGVKIPLIPSFLARLLTGRQGGVEEKVVEEVFKFHYVVGIKY
jgi:hypothetical protein